MNVYFKRSVIFVCLLCVLTFGLRPQYAKANPIGGVVIAAGAGVSAPVALGVCAVVLTASAVWAVTPQKNKELVLQSCSELSKDVDNFVLSTCTATAETIVGLSAKGINALKGIMNDVYVANKPIALGDGSYYLSQKSSSVSSDSYTYLCEFTPSLITCTKTDGSKISGSVSSGWGCTSISVHNYTYGWNGYSAVEVGGYSLGGHMQTVVADFGYRDIGITVNVASGSICPDKVLYKEKVDALGSVPVNYGIPVSVSADGTMYNPTKDLPIIYPDVLGPTGAIPSDYAYDGTTSVSIPKADTIPTTGDTTGTIDTDTGIFSIPILGDILKILQKILEAIMSIPLLLQQILDFFKIDTAEIAKHVDYAPILRTHFKPFYDLTNLLSNIQSSPQTSNGKFYMKIPHEMGGDDQEHCVLDLSVGSAYIVLARDIIKYGIWIGFLWFVLRMFSPKFQIGG